MSATQLDPVGSGYHPPVIDRHREENEQDDAANHFGLLDIQKQDTAATAEDSPESESEKGQRSDPEKPRHVGFWSHELVNVRLHVIKLWCRTGKTNAMTFEPSE